jgi:hypothetical protein
MDKKIRTKIIALSVIFTLVIYALIVYVKFGELIEIVSASIIISTVTCLWLLVDFYLWKLRFVGKFLHAKPNINGKWEGFISNDKEDKPHSAILIIKQTWTTIDVITKSERANSTSFSANIMPTSDGEAFYELTFNWRGEVKKTKAFDGVGGITGTSILTIDEEKNELVGNYFTNMSPEQSMGNLNFKKMK